MVGPPPAADVRLYDALRALQSKAAVSDGLSAACLQALAPFAETLEAQHIREDILPAFVDLTRDDQDSVRLIAGKIICL